MSAEKKKRKYTFRKDQPFPYKSGTLIHEGVRTAREQAKRWGFSSSSKKTSKKQKRK